MNEGFSHVYSFTRGDSSDNREWVGIEAVQCPPRDLRSHRWDANTRRGTKVERDPRSIDQPQVLLTSATAHPRGRTSASVTR